MKMLSETKSASGGKKLLVTAITIFLFCIPLVSNAIITFERTYGETVVGDVGNCVQQTKDGGYIITGQSHGTKNAIPLIKTDSLGDTLWTRIILSFYYLVYVSGKCVLQTTDNGYIIAGAMGTGDFPGGGIIIKTDSTGDTLWGKGSFAVASIQQTTDNGYFIAGGFYYPSLCKIDSLGATVWEKTFYNPNPEGGSSYFSGGKQLPDKGYIACGVTCTYDSTYHFFDFLLKTDSLGDSLWAKKIDDISGIRDFQRTTDNGYIVIGHTYIGANNTDICLLKTDSLGNTLWTKTFGGSKWDVASAARQTTDGGYVITGYTTSLGDSDVWLIKTDSLGDTLWTKTFGGKGKDGGNCVEQTADGGYIITGYKGSDIYLIKTDSVGNIGIEEKLNIKNQNVKIEIMPNPFCGETIIRCFFPQNSEYTNIRLTIYDLSGRIVKTFSQSEIKSSNIKWNGVNEKGIKLKNGVYFCKLTSNGKTIREKLVLMR